MTTGGLCEADRPLPDGNVNYNIDNCDELKPEWLHHPRPWMVKAHLSAVQHQSCMVAVQVPSLRRRPTHRQRRLEVAAQQRGGGALAGQVRQPGGDHVLCCSGQEGRIQ